MDEMNDNWNYEEEFAKEARRQEIDLKKKDLDLQAQAMAEMQIEHTKKQQDEFTKKTFDDALKNAGINQEKWNRLCTENPQAAYEAFGEMMEGYVNRVVSNRPRDPETGKQQAQPQQPALDPQQQKESLAQVRERHNKEGTGGTSREVQEMVNALFGPDFWGK